MHIGLICYEYPPAVHGGVGTFTKTLAEGLVNAGQDVTVVGIYQPRLMKINKPMDQHQNGVRVIRLLPTQRRVPNRIRIVWERYRLTRALRKIHQQKPFDLIECPESTGWLIFGGPPKVPIISRLTGSQLFFDAELNRKGSRLLHLCEKLFLSRADHLVAISDYVGKRTLSLAGLENRDYEVIYIAVDADKFSPDESASVEEGLVVFANTIHVKKGICELVKAINLLGDKYPQVHLVAMGKTFAKTKDGQLLVDALLNSVPSRIRRRITFTGWLDSHDDVLACLRRAQVCCYPSHAEGLGIAPIEAMSLGKPTIFMDRGPGPEVIEDGVSGLLCDTQDPQDIASKIEKIIQKPVLASELGKAARERVLRLFDSKHWIDENLKYYQDCLEKGSAMSSLI